MNDPKLYIDKILHEVLGEETDLLTYRPVASGNNQGIYLETASGTFFLKSNLQGHTDIFKQEINGLDLLRKNSFLTIPRIYGQGRIGDLNYLLMEWVPSGRRKNDYWEELARG